MGDTVGADEQRAPQVPALVTTAPSQRRAGCAGSMVQCCCAWHQRIQQNRIHEPGAPCRSPPAGMSRCGSLIG